MSQRKKQVFVVFGKDFPKKSKKWYQRFDEIIGPKELANFITPGNVQQAYELVNELSRLVLPDGSRLSKLINYQGYELWWINYDSMYSEFCLPYTQYRRLLLYLKEFDKVYLYQAPHSQLFRYFLKVHNRQCIVFNKFQFRNLLPIPLGIFIQIVLSIGFLPWLKITGPQLMLWTSDKFDPPNDFDFRMKFIYEELRKRKVPFVEFIRGLESSSTTLKHAWKRKRPVFYSAAIISILHSLARRFNHLSLSFSASDPEKQLLFLIATHYLNNSRGTIWSIRAMKFIIQWIGIKAAIISAGCNRNFHEVLGCKLVGIGTVGIQHGLAPKHYLVSDFMPEFDGKAPLSIDRYGLWSNWWKEYYLSYSRAYRPEQLYVSGPMRPLERERGHTAPETKKRKLAVLFISEQLAAPKEVMPYLLKLLSVKDLTLYLKFRPYRDGFEGWLRENQPDILKKARIFRGTTQQAISQVDMVVGSHSTAVLEALAQLKPFVFFWTDKWGDYFNIKSLDIGRQFFADTPEDLVDHIRKNNDMPKETIKQLQEIFLGDPYQNGSKWVVEQAIEYAKQQ